MDKGNRGLKEIPQQGYLFCFRSRRRWPRPFTEGAALPEPRRSGACPPRSAGRSRLEPRRRRGSRRVLTALAASRPLSRWALFPFALGQRRLVTIGQLADVGAPLSGQVEIAAFTGFSRFDFAQFRFCARRAIALRAARARGLAADYSLGHGHPVGGMDRPHPRQPIRPGSKICRT